MDFSMHNSVFTATVAAASLCALEFAQASPSQDEVQMAMAKYAKEQFADWIQRPQVVAAIRSQNNETATYDETLIQQLDQEWRDAFASGDLEIINAVLENDLSQYLLKHVLDAQGRISEVIVMDGIGLNVAQTALTSDFWQGDEAKYLETYKNGPDGVHVSEIEQGETPMIYQKQVSLSITDPLTRDVVGAVTISLNAWYFY
jgi:Trk K+ transport system NAD-binding subunit